MNELAANQLMSVPPRRSVEDLVDELARLWDLGERPDLPLFLKQTGPLTADELASVLRADQRRRWLAGERIFTEIYLRDFSQVSDDPSSAIDLIYNEFLLRERCGERPEAAEYVQRFPEYASVLTSQIEFHAAMASSSAPEIAELEVGRPLVPGYEVLEELGRGGMGVVYKARHLRLKRIVALKMLLAGSHAGPEQLVRFRAEAEAIARLQHSNIVQIHEVGEVDGRPFLSLEYVDGGNLKGRLRGTPLPTQESARTIETLARAVHYAHVHGVVHRDLKPANVLVGASPSELKIADFGLAKLLADQPEAAASGATHSHSLLGTPSYMAPEQAAGKHRQVGPASDVYALGAILYELLTGRPPFQGETPLDTLQQVLADEPVPPARLRGKIPHDLQTICLKCLEKDPLRRYGTSGELADDLMRFGAGLPIAARPVSSLGRAWRWSRRNPRLATMLAATAFLLVVMVAGAVLWSLDRSAALGRAQQAEADAARKLYDSRLSEARARSLSRRPGQRFATLALLDEAARQARDLSLPATHRDELRNVTIAALLMPDLYPNLTRCSATAWFDFDDDLAIYARCDDSGATSVRRVDTDEELHAIPGINAGPQLSRDGRYLVIFDRDNRISVWRLDQSPSRMTATLDRVSSLDFHADGQRLAIAQQDGAISLFELASGELIRRLPPQLLTHDPVIALHPFEPLIAIASYFDSTVQIRNLKTGDIEKSLDMEDGCSHLAWHPSGQWLAASDGNGPDIQVFDRATFQRQRRIGPIAGGARIHFNQTGDRLAVFDWSSVSTVKLFDFATGRCLFELPNAGLLNVLRFSRADQRLAGYSRDGRLGFWEIADGREYRTLTRKASFKTATLDSGAISPDGRLLAIALGESICFWDMASGIEIADLQLEGVRSLYFEPGGALVSGHRAGTFRWPIEPDPKTAGRRKIGPPQPLTLPPSGLLSSSRDGRVIASRNRLAAWEAPFAGAWVLDPEHPASPLHLNPGADIGNIAVSPDGTRVVTSHFHTGPVKIWDARTGRLERQLSESGGLLQFSPDGRWLVVGGDNSHFYATADWRLEKTRPGTVCFSPDGKLFVVGAGDHTFGLFDVATDRELARFEDPNRHPTGTFVFSPDGAQLVSMDHNSRGIHVWDLRVLRRQLAGRGLDWDAPAYPSGPTAEVPLQLQIEMGDFLTMSQDALAASYARSLAATPHLAERWNYRAQFHQKAGRHQLALNDLQTAVKLAPNFDEACNSLAWLYTTGPVSLRDPQRAVTLAEHVTKLRVGNQNYLNTLGVAYYRAGRLPEAVTTLKKSLLDGSGQSDAYDLYFLALCYRELGHPDQARASFEQARVWHERKQGRLSREQAEELARFRTEAQEALRIKAPSDNRDEKK